MHSSRIVPAASNLVQVVATNGLLLLLRRNPNSGTLRDTRADPRSTRGGGAWMARYSAMTYHNLSTRVAVAGWGW